MYNIYLLKGIIEEAEILLAEASFYVALGRLVDDKVAARVQSFWDRCDAYEPLQRDDNVVANRLRESISLSKKILGDIVFINQFPTKVKEKAIQEKLSVITPSLLRYYPGDMEELRESTEWFLGNRKNWRQYIEPRTNEDYKSFLIEVANLEQSIMRVDLQSPLSEASITPLYELVKRVKDNKEFFYMPHEKRRSTGMHDLISRSLDIEAIHHGIEYLQIIGAGKHAVSAKERRRF